MYSFSFVATVDGESITSSIGGYDGDETRTVNVSVNQKRRFTDAQKAAMAKASADLNTDAAVLTVIAAACLAIPDSSVTKICAFGGGLSAGAVWLLSGILNQLALDPADPNYAVIASPIFPILQNLSTQPGITQAEADALNAWLSNLEQAIGYGRAAITSINRADGAYAAGNTYWEAQQMQAAAQYALKLSSLLSMQPALRAAVFDALQAAGFPVITASPNDVYNFEIGVLSGSLPTFLTDALTQLGADAAEIEHIRRLAYVQNINVVADSFPALLKTRAANTSIVTAAQSVLDFSIANGVPLAAGQEAEGEGFIAAASGSRIAFEFEVEVNNGTAGGLRGKLQLRDRGLGLVVRSTRIARAVVIGQFIVVDGEYAASDGTTGTFRIIAADNARQGKGNDSFSVNLSTGYSASGVLGGGNINVKAD